MPRSKPVLMVCQGCHRQFESLHYKPSRPNQYCSKACAGIYRRLRVTLVCRQCARPFERKRYMADWSQERGPFCGFQCYAAWQSEHVTGPANPWFREQSPARAAGQFERNRKLALERDGHRCVRCQSPDDLHVHHVEPWAPGQPDPHALGNLVTLCASCHRLEHPLPHGPGGRFQSP
jgi:hypothetical protein